MPAPYSITFDDAEGLLMAKALERFADQSRDTLREFAGRLGPVWDAVLVELTREIEVADALLKRINDARY